MAAPKEHFWMPFHFEKYLADTSALSLAAHGALLLLHIHYFRHGPIEDNDAVLARIVHAAPHEWRHIRRSIERYFDTSDGVWINEDWDVEAEEATMKSAKAKKKARDAANKRWANARARAAMQSAGDEECSKQSSEQCLSNASYNYSYTDMPPCPGHDDEMGDVDEDERARRYAEWAAFGGDPGHADPGAAH